MMNTETPAGRMARTMPELDSRERTCLLAENQHRELARVACSPAAAWLLAWERSAIATVKNRADDARALAWAKHHAASLGIPAGECAAYWAALP